MIEKLVTDHAIFHFESGYFGSLKAEGNFIVIDIDDDDVYYEFRGIVGNVLDDLLCKQLSYGEVKKSLLTNNSSKDEVESELHELVNYLIDGKIIALGA